MKYYLIALSCLAAPAAAQDAPAQFALPQGCDAFLSVQLNSCTVSHHFVCEGDPEGHQRRVTLDEEGLTFAGEIDAEAQWIQSIHPRSGHADRLAPDPADPASLSNLIENGVDTYDFITLSDEIGPTRYVGEDTLTGRQITIDDITLDETTYDITALSPDGDVIWQSKGREFISRNWRMFISGTGTTTVGSESFERDESPVEFIFPGEPGFLSPNPKHGCGVAIS